VARYRLGRASAAAITTKKSNLELFHYFLGEMEKRLLLVVMVFAVLNGYAAFVTSKFYTAWSIRVRNETLYFLFGKHYFKARADEADSIAERVLSWARPLAFILANFIAVVASIHAYLSG
jgi:hypothetical protein